MADPVTLYEVGPRDGLQNEAQPVATADKIHLIALLTKAGLTHIEATAFVSPKWVPQMADASAVMAGISPREGIVYAALTPNLKGYARAKAAGVTEVAVFAAASEGFSKANLNASIAESLERFAPVAASAAEDGITLRGYVSCVADCPYDGPTPPAAVARVTRALFGLGCREVSLGDTTGKGRPEGIDAMLAAVLEVASPERLAGHYHDTAGHALENVVVSLERGLRVFDTAAGGLGGCPYAPGAAGNVATEAVAALLSERGHPTGIDLERLDAAARFAKSLRSSR